MSDRTLVIKKHIRSSVAQVIVYRNIVEEEYVAVPNGNWDAAYYSDDWDDVLDTANNMAGLYPVEEIKKAS